MYNVRIRNEQAMADTRADGRGIAARSRRGRVYQFGSLVQAQQLAKLMRKVLRLG
jgi:hypothetical protein